MQTHISLSYQIRVGLVPIGNAIHAVDWKVVVGIPRDVLRPSALVVATLEHHVAIEDTRVDETR